MATKKPAPAPSVQEGLEWQAGIYQLPSRGEGTPNEVLIWKVPLGKILGFETGSQGELLPRAGALLREALNRSNPLPGTLRVASEELAAQLRPAISRRIELLCAPTPELDATLDEMQRRVTEGQSYAYLASGADEETVAGFYRAAAWLFRSKPWQVMADSEDLLQVSIEELGLPRAVVSVVGRGDQDFGFSLFATAEDFYYFLDFDPDADDLAETPVPLLALTYNAKMDLPPELAQELEEKGYEVAGKEAHPWLMAYDEESHDLRPASETELRQAEALCLALPEILVDKDALFAALRGEGPQLSQRVRVSTAGGEIEVALSTEIEVVEATPELARPEHPLLGLFYDLESEEEVDLESRLKLEAQMFELFAASPHGAPYPDARYSRLILELAAEHFASTVASLTPLALYELLHELLPGDGRVGPEEADDLVAELRAFFEFLAEDFSWELAKLCRSLLDDEAAATLRSALVDTFEE